MKSLIFLLFFLVSFTSFSISYVWVGTTNTDWATPTNWSPVGIPDLSDDVEILAAPNNCILDANRSIDLFDMTSGILDLNGFTLTVSQNATFPGGNIVNGSLTVNSTPTDICNLGGTLFDATLTITSGRIFLNGGVYNRPCVFNQTGAVNTGSAGGAEFNDVFEFTLSGNGYFRTNGSNTFNGATTFINNGGDYILFGLANGNVYNGTLTLINNSTSNIRMAYQGANQFNGDIELNNTVGGNILFCEQATATAQLGSAVEMTVGALGFSDGILRLNRISQLDATPQSLLLTGTASIDINSSDWEGILNITSPRLSVDSSIFNEAVFFEKTGNGNDDSGGNTFNGDLSITNSANNYIRFGINNPDIFQGDLTLINNGTSSIRIAENTLGNIINGNTTVFNTSNSDIVYFARTVNADLVFNGNIELNSDANANGVRFGNDGGTAILSNGFQITIGALGFQNGELYFRNFHQQGATPQNILLTGTARLFQYDSEWDADFTCVTPRFYTRGTIYNGITYLEKNGPGDDNSLGDNVFNSVTTLVNSSDAIIRMAHGLTNPDIFNDEVIISNRGTNRIRMANRATGNEFNGNIIVENPSGIAVDFGIEEGDAILANGRNVIVGALGFSDGDLYFRNFTQLGLTPQNITLTGTARLVQYDAEWNADFTCVAPRIYTRGTVYNGLTYLEKNGATNDDSFGDNVFNQNATLVNSGSDRLRFGSNAPDIFNGETTASNIGTSVIWLADNSSGNEFNGNIIVENTGGEGVYFGRGGVGDAILAAGFNVSVGALGFTDGQLHFRDFTKLGVLPTSLTLSGTALLYNFDANWEGDFTAVSPRILTRGTTYNGVTYLEKNGDTNDESFGDNVFHQATSIVNAGSNRLRFGTNAPDIFNGVTRISNTGTDVIWMADNSAGNQFNGDIIVENTGGDGVYFGRSGIGEATQAAGFSVTVGGLGFTDGQLHFRDFTQLGAEPTSLILSGTALLYNYDSNWGGDFTCISPRVITRGTIYNGVTYLEKNGAANDDSFGDNVFQQNTSLVNAGSNRLRFGSNAPDIFNGETSISNTGTDVIWMADNSAGNEFNGNIIVENTGGNGVYFGRGGSGEATQAAGFNVSVGGLGFTDGQLHFRDFTQLGVVPTSLTLSGIALLYNYDSNWGGDFTCISPRIITRGTTYNGITYLEKNGANNDVSNGDNLFQQTTSILNTGSGIFYMAHGLTNPDVFNGDLTVSNQGTGRIRMANRAAGNQFNGNITVENLLGNGVKFGIENGDATLANGMAVTVGALGFSTGDLYFRNFNQIGATPQNITLTGDARLVQFTSSWDGDFTCVSPRIYLRSTVFNGITFLEKNGAPNETSYGDNTFNQTAELVTSGTGYWRTGNNFGNTFNADAIYRELSSGNNRPAYGATSYYYGNIDIESPGSAMYFSQGNGRVEFMGGAAQQISLIGGGGQNPWFRRLTTNKTGGEVTINTAIEIITELDLQAGNIVSNATDLLIMTDNSVVAAVSDAAFVDGPVRKIGNDAFVFPVGKVDLYRPCGISAPANGGHHFTAEYFLESPWPMYDGNLREPTLQSISNCEYWMIDRTNGNSNVVVTLSWNTNPPHCSGVIDPNELAVARWDGGIWRDEGNGGTTGTVLNGTINSLGPVTDFSPFTLASVDAINPLPIELLSFEANANLTDVDLTWSTASEKNNDYFEIEKSKDGVNFEFVEKINGAGTSTQQLDYFHTDQKPYAGLSYYRLKQVDFDGAETYSDVRSVEIFTSNNLTIFPNPVASGGEISFDVESEYENIEVRIIDIAGKLVLDTHLVNSKLSVDLPKGIYMVQVETVNEIQTAKLIVQ